MSVSVTGYGGIGEIGGNKLLLEDGDWQVMLDFGLSFGARSRYFEEFVKPRTSLGTHDYLRTGLLPPLEGLYRRDFEALDQSTRLWVRLRATPGYRNDVRPLALLLSHAHADHVGYAAFLRDDIPIVASAVTAVIAKAIQDSSVGGVEAESVYTSARTVKNELLTPRGKGDRGQRIWQILDWNRWGDSARSYWEQPVRTKTGAWDTIPATAAADTLEGHRVRSYPVDHSIRGARGFAIETSAGWIGYSGDIRLHGDHGDDTRRFAQALGKLDLSLLICEGTQAPKPPGLTEEDVRASTVQAVENADGLVIGDFGPRNIERLETFLDAARHAGRQLVVLAKDALLLHAMHAVDPTVPLPDPARQPLVFQDRRASTTGWQDFVEEKFGSSLVDASDIAGAPSEYVIAMSYFDAPKLLDVNPQGGAWIYSSSEPYDLEQEVDMERLANWVSLFGMRMLGSPGEGGFHASGHSSGPDLLRFIETAQPRRLMPIHLEDAGLAFYRREIPRLGIELLEPTWGQPITVPA